MYSKSQIFSLFLFKTFLKTFNNNQHVTPRPDEVQNTCNYTGRICAPSVIVKDKIVKFSKNYGTFAIKESRGGESIINGNLNSKVILINCHNFSGKSKKFSRSRMTKRTTPLSSPREI